MRLIFGLDIGTTSIGFAVIDHDPNQLTGNARRLGTRIFPEARDPKGTPLNQERRAARLRRRQLRRRRDRRQLLGDLLCEAGLLPARNSPEWSEAMKYDPYGLRKRAFEGDALSPHEVGRAIYHLAQRRHFKGRDIDEIADDSESENQKQDAAEKRKEKEAKSERETTVKTLEQTDTTLGAWLAERGPHERKRDVHATREIVEKEFNEVWGPLVPEEFKEAVRDAIFSQRPVFWRRSTLGTCPFVPGALLSLCPKGSWLSQQKRMLEKLNNLQIAGGNQRPLDSEERAAILERLQTQASMTWGSVRTALRPLYKSRGDAGKAMLKFNLEEGGDTTLMGNPLEAKLNKIFGADWMDHPHKQEVRDAVHARIWQADYGEIGQRVVIRPATERKKNRETAAQSFIKDFGVSEDRATQLAELKLAPGWEPYSVEALQAFLPHLEAGVRFGTLLNSPDREDWRNATFPNREQPTGEILDRLPSPVDRKEADRQRNLRNPTVVRVHNELRKVVNNLMSRYGRPDIIRVELAREVGLPKSKRDEIALGNRRRERQRKAARDALEENGVQPSRDNIEKWLLWQECGHRCPYTGDPICFDDLFGKVPHFDVEHIWPRSLSFDDSFRNKTLCRKDVNLKKSNRTPFEYLGHDAEAWAALENRLKGMKAAKGGIGMSPGKIKRFLAQSIPDDFANRQLADTAYAAREAVAFLKKLGPDIQVQAVSGRVTGHLRRLWGLNNILADTGEKTRADHRHHAIDALVVACCGPGVTQKLSRYWQDKDNPNPRIREPRLLPPWETIRADAKQAVADLVVSHRVRKKVSGPLHEGLFYGDTREEETGKDGITHRHYVKRKNIEELSKSELAAIRDEDVREIVREWVDKRGGDPKKAFPPYPKRGRRGPEIRKVRLLMNRQARLMAPVATGYAELGNNHHMAIYRLPNGDVDFPEVVSGLKASGIPIYRSADGDVYFPDVVSLWKASGWLSRGKPVVRRERDAGARFLMSLSPGDVVEFQEGDKRGLWVVHGISSAGGRPTLANINDARPTSAQSQMDGTREDFEPRFGGFMRRRPIKLSVDPIGHVRSAND